MWPEFTKTFAGNTATIVTSTGVFNPGPDQLDYAPPPNNVASLYGGFPAQPFTIPLAVI